MSMRPEFRFQPCEPLVRLARFINLLVLAAGIAVVGNAVGSAAESYAFTTVAGAPGSGYADGASASARFAMPEGVALDASGNVYVADNRNYVIRKVTPAGVVTTLAGVPGVPGYANGTGVFARFNSITAIALDRTGALLVSDSGNSVIRRVTLTGAVTTVAGVPGSAGAVDGAALTAKFDEPTGLTTDAAGNIYVADSGNHAIRRISTTGTVSTYAGVLGTSGSADGPAATATFNYPSGVAFDAAGSLYVTDTDNNVIRKIAADGTVSTYAGAVGPGDWLNGTGGAARFSTPLGIAADAGGNLYVADFGNQVIRYIISGGVVGTIIGIRQSRGYVDGALNVARLFYPSGVAVDSSSAVYIADTYNNSIRKATFTGGVTTLAGLSGVGSADGYRTQGSFFLPRGLAADRSGNVFVADSYNHTIRKVAPDGTVVTYAGHAGARGSADGAAADARFTFPHAVAVDLNGNVFVADDNNHTIRKIAPNGVVVTLAGLAGSSGSADGAMSAARFNFPEGIGTDAAGNIFVADSGNGTIRKVTPDGVVTTLAGAAGSFGDADGTGPAARFRYPWGLTVDNSGNIFVTDVLSNVIRKITPAGVVTTIAGSAGSGAEIDGKGASARFNDPEGIAADANGVLYVTDAIGQSIRKISPDGTVVTTGGAANVNDYADGIGASARFSHPVGAAVDRFGNLYISDYYNNSVRKAGLVGATTPASVLSNLSVRANVTAGQRLIVGFGTTGGPKSVLLRAVGPGLQPYISGLTLAGDPSVELYSAAGALLDANNNWGGSATLSTAFAQVGAFPLTANSLDAALLRNVDGVYTAHMLTAQSGLGLVELYDTASATVGTRLTNLSARYQVGTGSDVLVAGFSIGGSGPKTVLIRGVGPSLAALFGVSDALSDTVLNVYDAKQQRIATSDHWDVHLLSAFNQVGAFQLPIASPDAALLLSLPPGAYTAQLSGAAANTGNGLIEVYEIGN